MADHGLDSELLALVEIPKGSRNKYEFDEGIQRVIMDRFLSSSTVYPTDYGYLIGHRGRDGDPLDVLVCVSEPTFPGCVIPVKPIALFEMRDEMGDDDKIICVPLNDPGWNQLEDLDDLSEQFQLEVAHFFSVYKQLEHKPVEIGGWHSRADAIKVIEDAARLHEEHEAGRA
jgi:inorganic pyrophosphatase